MENEEDVIIDTSNDIEEETIETPESTEDTPEVDVDQLQATNKKLFERAKKAEAELKLAKQAKPTSTVSPQASIEETVLLANGMSEELLGELKAVASVRKVSLIKAQADPIFVAMKEKFEKEQKQKDSSMPASRGSSGVKPRKDFSTQNLSREEHMAMMKEKLQ